MNKAQIKMMVNQYWDKYDKNKNGKLEISEAKNFLKELFQDNSDKLSDKELKIIFNEIDENCDKKLSKTEIMDFLYNS